MGASVVDAAGGAAGDQGGPTQVDPVSPDGGPAGAGLGPLTGRLEAILFAAAEPVGLARLAAAAGASEAETRLALRSLAAHLDAHGHGVGLVETAGGFQLLTRPEHVAAVAALASPRQAALSRAALETLAIIAFRQPVTRAAVDELRGVHSEGAISTLVERGLVLETGRADAPGRPFLYGTTRRFLDHFGLRSLGELGEEGRSARIAARWAGLNRAEGAAGAPGESATTGDAAAPGPERPEASGAVGDPQGDARA